ncbi:hypothetical protein ACP70R_023996 [Stipagrostis hirtigluma subsp. patula]
MSYSKGKGVLASVDVSYPVRKYLGLGLADESKSLLFVTIVALRLMDSDDALSFFSDDDDDNDIEICISGNKIRGLSHDSAVDEAIFQWYKKHRRIGSSFFSDHCNLKSKKGNNIKSSFSGLCFKYFCDLVNSLAPDQISIIERFGFGCVLSFPNCTVPKCFVHWLSSIIDIRTSELVLKDRVIPFSKLSFHKILGVPVGGEVIVGDYEAGKSFLVSKFGIDKIESIQFFADKLTGAYDMTDEEVFICFMIVAIGCFFCPKSSYEPLIKLVHILEHPSEVRKYDWSLHLHDVALQYVSELHKRLWKTNTDSNVFCSSAYVLAVLYLDCVNFGSFNVSPEIPRTSFWKGSVIKFCSELDELKPGKYGRRPLKLAIDSSYGQNVQEVLGNAVLNSSVVVEFKSNLESLYGDVLPEELKLGICKIYAAHCVEEAKRSEHSCQELLFKIFSLCNEVGEKFKNDNSFCEAPTSHVATHFNNGDVEVNLSPQNLFDNIQEVPSGKTVHEDQNVADCFDLSLDIGYKYETFGGNVQKDEVPTAPMEMNHDTKCPGLHCSNCVVEDQVQDKVQDNDVFLHEKLAALPKPVVDLSTPGFIVGRNFSSSAPSLLIADSPIAKQKKFPKSQVFGTKPSLLDLNNCLPDSVFGSGNYITPKDNVLEFDTTEKIAQVKDLLPVAQSHMSRCPNVFGDGSRVVFDVETQQYVRFRNDVHKEKFVSKSGSFLSRLQIADLNVPLLQSEEITADKISGGLNTVNDKEVGALLNSDLKAMSKGFASQKHSQHHPTIDQIPIGTSVNYVVIPDNEEDNLCAQQIKTIPVIDVDQEEQKQCHDGNEVQFMGEISFKDKIRSLCNKSEVLYNQTIALCPSSFDGDCAGPSVLKPSEEASKPVHAAFQGPFICRPATWSSKFVVTAKEKRNYIAACRLASSTKWNEELGNSLRTGCKVGSYVINALCRKFFLDRRPTISKKHYFFSGVGAILLKGYGNMSYVKKCFDGAASVLPLHRADMLLFPICHDDHWFVFIVDIKNSLFVFLDSYYSGDDDYHVFVRSNLVPSFKKHWNELVRGPIDFDKFDIVYPPVPKQNNLVDCGVFVIMFLTFWTWYCGLCIDFSQADIDNIRIYTISDLVCSEHNIANASPLINWFGEGSFPRVGQIRKSTVQY